MTPPLIQISKCILRVDTEMRIDFFSLIDALFAALFSSVHHRTRSRGHHSCMEHTCHTTRYHNGLMRALTPSRTWCCRSHLLCRGLSGHSPPCLPRPFRRSSCRRYGLIDKHIYCFGIHFFELPPLPRLYPSGWILPESTHSASAKLNSGCGLQMKRMQAATSLTLLAGVRQVLRRRRRGLEQPGRGAKDEYAKEGD